ncbi:MAG: sugar ABC transporter permease YjfF [Treponema sp.]|mgnify:CR=1 FL=1|nr:sugar ABC transporter permease YjfF [Spirochaetia bacterium]MDD6970340.1 sugar ABC transporter permease YjfF [Spirochaetales bacterium]MDY4523602.1 sugar ABC transporter permease YjfF [Treponema sp.]MDD7609791.1 sugar ABC transporter permease YjfF [Spirochaetales bacterium]MDY5914809.1 sugar ABC transporter permease YjfF [Treponema sp.]
MKFFEKIKNFFAKKFKQPVSNTSLLLTITICTFVAMYVFAMIVWGGGFLNPQQFFNIFNNNAYLIIISCGLTLVMISGGIDISVGGQIALITMTTVCMMENKGSSVFGAFIVAIAIGLAFGIVQGFFVSYLKIQPFIVTLAGMFFAKGMTTIVSVNPVTVKANETFLKIKDAYLNLPIGTYARNGNFIPSYLEIGAIVAIVIVLIMWAVLKWTRIGRNFYAIGGNSESALMLGINVQRTRFMAYVICGLLAGLAGFVYLLHTGAGNASNADGAEMEAIASSIIGGTLLTGGVGSVIGTLFGVMSLKTINTIVIASGLTQPWWQKITTGLMLCFFILLQSVILSARKKKLGAQAA